MTRAVFAEDVAARKGGVASQYPEVVRPNILRPAAAVKRRPSSFSLGRSYTLDCGKRVLTA